MEVDMADYINNEHINEEESDELIDEFKELITSVSQEIIDNSVMDDLIILREGLTEKMNVFSEQADKINSITSSIDNLLSQTTENMTSAIQRTTSEMSHFLSGTTEMLDEKFSTIKQDLGNILNGTTETLDNKFSTITDRLNQVFDTANENINHQFSDVTTDVNNQLKGAAENIGNVIYSTTQGVEGLLTEATANMATAASDVSGVVASISSKLEQVLEINTESMGEVLEKSANQIELLIGSTNQSFEKILEEASNDMKTTASDVDSAVKSISSKLDQVLINNTEKMNGILNQTTDQMNHLIGSTTESFSSEIKEIKDFLINSDKLISNNQRTIADIQRNIEAKLNQTLVQVVEESDKSKENAKEVVTQIEGLVEKISRENFGLVELNNMVNIKVDNGLGKLKTTIEKVDELSLLLENEVSVNKRFKVMLVVNLVALFSVLLSCIYLFMRG